MENIIKLLSSRLHVIKFIIFNYTVSFNGFELFELMYTKKMRVYLDITLPSELVILTEKCQLLQKKNKVRVGFLAYYLSSSPMSKYLSGKRVYIFLSFHYFPQAYMFSYSLCCYTFIMILLKKLFFSYTCPFIMTMS